MRNGWKAVGTAFGLVTGVVLATPTWALPLVSNARPAARPANPWVYVTADSGNMARYRVREQLVGHDLPNDAVGSTGAITGSLTIGPDGKIDAATSKFVVELKPLKSDQACRDGYVQSRILETAQYPTAVLVPTSVSGLPIPLPTSGAATFDLVGDLTVHGATRPTRWHVSANVNGKDLTGTASTWFTFGDFGLNQPHVPILLSLVDTIRLEYDLHLVRK